MSTKDFKNIIINNLTLLLKPMGFRRRGNIYILEVNDLIYYISLQSSKSSTANVLQLTVNLQMASKRLDVFEDEPVDQRIYTKRIGFFSEEKKDKWWLIGNLQEAHLASEQINGLLFTKAIPAMQEFKTIDDFIAIWQQGKATGITDGQRKRFLALLNA